MNKSPINLIIAKQALRYSFFFVPYATVQHCLAGFNPFPELFLPVLAFVKKEISQWAFYFYSQEEMKKMSREIFFKFVNKSDIDEFVEQVKHQHHEALQNLQKLKDVRQLSHSQLLTYYMQGYSALGYALRCMMIIRLADIAAQQEIKDILHAAILCQPTKKSYTFEEEIDLLTTTNLAQHAEKWGWISLGYFKEQPSTIAHFQKRLQEIEDRTEYKKKLLNDFNERLAQQQRVMEHCTEPQKNMVYTIQEMAWLKDYLKRFFNEVRQYVNLILDEIDKRFGVKSRYYTTEETEQLLRNSIRLNNDVINRRKNIVLMCQDKQNVSLDYGREAEGWEKSYFFHEEDKPTSTFSGRVASEGRAKGKVRIVVSGQDLSIFEDGEILVTNNTTPDFVPIMKKSAAIIAEEGGLTTHTAVVSRELKKPCIVGVQNITHLLKNGQEIEVDAIKGCIKVLR